MGPIIGRLSCFTTSSLSSKISSSYSGSDVVVCECLWYTSITVLYKHPLTAWWVGLQAYVLCTIWHSTGIYISFSTSLPHISLSLSHSLSLTLSLSRHSLIMNTTISLIRNKHYHLNGVYTFLPPACKTYTLSVCCTLCRWGDVV